MYMRPGISCWHDVCMRESWGDGKHRQYLGDLNLLATERGEGDIWALHVRSSFLELPKKLTSNLEDHVDDATSTGEGGGDEERGLERSAENRTAFDSLSHVCSR